MAKPSAPARARRPGWVSQDERLEPERPGDQRRAGADRAVADHDHPLARPGAAAVEGVEADGERLEQGADLVAYLVGQRHRAVGGEADERGEGAVGGEADRAAEAAEVVAARDAGLAAVAAPAGVGGDAVAGPDLGDALADRGDDGGELVAEGDRRLLPGQGVHAAGADREGGLELGDVGAADAGSTHLRLDHSRPERQLQLDVVEP